MQANARGVLVNLSELAARAAAGPDVDPDLLTMCKGSARRRARDDETAGQAFGAIMPKFGDVVIGVPCRGELGGDKDEQS